MLQTTDIQTLIIDIIERQKGLIGSLAIDQARKVTGIKIVNTDRLSVEIDSTDTQDLLTQLVAKYQELFGLTSVEACKEAVKESSVRLSDRDLPEILR